MIGRRASEICRWWEQTAKAENQHQCGCFSLPLSCLRGDPALGRGNGVENKQEGEREGEGEKGKKEIKRQSKQKNL